MSAAIGRDYVKKMVAQELRGPGDLPAAVRRVARDVNAALSAVLGHGRDTVGEGTLDNLRTGRTSRVDADLLTALRLAHVRRMERQLVRWEHELAVERARGNADADLQDMEREAEALVARLSQRRARLEGRS